MVDYPSSMPRLCRVSAVGGVAWLKMPGSREAPGGLRARNHSRTARCQEDIRESQEDIRESQEDTDTEREL